MAKSNVLKYVAAAACLAGFGQHHVAQAGVEPMCIRGGSRR